MVSNEPIKVRQQNWRGLTAYLNSGCQNDRPLFSTNLNIAFTCRQIWQEVTPIYYSCNAFKFDDSGTMPDFVKAIGPSNARAITTMEMNLCMLWIVFDLDKLLPGLCSIEIGCFVPVNQSAATSSALHRCHTSHMHVILRRYPSTILTYKGMVLSREHILHHRP